MTRSNQELIKEARRILAVATPGPWHLDGPDYHDDPRVPFDGDNSPAQTSLIADKNRNPIAFLPNPFVHGYHEGDAEFIAISKALVEELADALAELQWRIDGLEK